MRRGTIQEGISQDKIIERLNSIEPVDASMQQKVLLAADLFVICHCRSLLVLDDSFTSLNSFKA